ncbi:RagB/SusD family nutrient uptake outer membrane protein [Psychroflexus planctonicus]|uniref:Membrane protein n=1 Tax=Psychroflexus planctonicus TaxID=1526575 RepID=A0ABQ1SPL4_9FLAO|nr:RagB/SusD family nutrient uptake outer membrane protein [Psychroflexus planctonicus]GGE44851.1 membrane protein [Psychroflexus planctonicus]
MKKVILFISIFAILGCSDFLDRDPVEQTSTEQQLSSLEGVLQALNGSYREYEELKSSIHFVFADAFGGNVKFAPNQQGIPNIDPLFETVYTLNEEANAATYTSYYNGMYQLIYSVNQILLNVDDLPDASPEKINQIKAECLSIRASAHFELLNLFAQDYNFTADASHLGIVYAMDILEAGVDFPSRNTVQETFDLIEADLQDALQLYTSTSAIDFGASISYFNALNTRALLSRVYLYANRWEDAITYSSQVLSQQSQLTPREELVNQWSQFSPISETLLEFTPPISSDDGTTRSSVSGYYAIITNNDGEVIDNERYSASLDLVELYEENDIRGLGGLLETFEINTETPDGVEALPYHFVRKYPGDSGTMFMRLAEMYLNRAEANAKLGNETAAIADLMQIRLRANPNAGPINLSGEDLVEEILLERRRELAFEGHLFFDLMRNQKDLIRNDGCTIGNCNVNYPNFRFIMPIPLASELINENMEQNEGY